MHKNTHKEEFSYAYIHAIAATAGYGCVQMPRIMDLDGIDLTIFAPGILNNIQRPKVDIQVKCTSGNILKKDCIKFKLEVPTYDNLRYETPSCPQFLVIILVPDNVDEWLNVSEDELSMRRCGYWKSLKGEPKTSNTDYITITIPRINLFTVTSLKRLMHQAEEEENL